MSSSPFSVAQCTSCEAASRILASLEKHIAVAFTAHKYANREVFLQVHARL